MAGVNFVAGTTFRMFSFSASDILDPAFTSQDSSCPLLPQTPQFTSIPVLHPTSVHRLCLPPTLLLTALHPLGVCGRVPLRIFLAIGDRVLCCSCSLFGGSLGEMRESLPDPRPGSPCWQHGMETHTQGNPHPHRPVALATKLRKLGFLVSKATLCSANCYILHVRMAPQLVG